MELVVDANILFSFFRDNPVRFIIINSDLLGLKLFSPTHSLDELKNNISDLIKYTKRSLSEIESTIEEIKKFVLIIPSSQYEEFKKSARSLAPHKSDKDIPYFALALKLRCSIWSNEPEFKKQANIKVFNTQDLRDELKI